MILDRFEGEHAILELEKGIFVHVSRALVDASAKEGDVLIQVDGSYKPDAAQTAQINARVRHKMDLLFGRLPSDGEHD